MDDVTVLLALQEKDFWAKWDDSCGFLHDETPWHCLSIGFEPWFKPAASALHRHKLLNTTENNIDYARPWEPMDLDADDVVGALQERLLWYWCLAR